MDCHDPSTAVRLAQDILDQPNNGRLRRLGLSMLGINDLPDEQWSGPLPSVDFGTDEVTAAVRALNAAWSQTTLHRLVALRILAWKASMLQRALAEQQDREHKQQIASNGGHTRGMLAPDAAPPSSMAVGTAHDDGGVASDSQPTENSNER